MSRVRARLLTDKAAVWKQSTPDAMDPYAPAYIRCDIIDCRYASGGDQQRGQDGGTFNPQSTFYTLSDIASRGDVIALGEHFTDSPAEDAETIKKIVTKTPLRGAQSYTYYTG